MIAIGIDNVRPDDHGQLNRETESIRAAHRVVPEACQRCAVGEDQPLHQLLRLELLRVRGLPLDQRACDTQSESRQR